MTVTVEGVMRFKDEAYAMLDAYKHIETITEALEPLMEQEFCKKEVKEAINTIRENLQELKEPVKYIARVLVTITEGYLEVFRNDIINSVTENNN